MYGQARALQQGPAGGELWRRLRGLLGHPILRERLGAAAGQALGLWLAAAGKLEAAAAAAASLAGSSAAGPGSAAAVAASAGAVAGGLPKELVLERVLLEARDQLRLQYGAHAWDSLLPVLAAAAAYYPDLVRGGNQCLCAAAVLKLLIFPRSKGLGLGASRSTLSLVPRALQLVLGCVHWACSACHTAQGGATFAGLLALLNPAHLLPTLHPKPLL